MDGCTAHKFEDHLQLLARRNITVVFLPAHSSHLTQPLDLGIFGRVKSILRGNATYSIDRDEDEDDAVGHDIDRDVNLQLPGPRRASRSRTSSAK